MKTRHWIILAVIIYALGFCVAYGHAWNHVRPLGSKDRADRGADRFILTLAAATVWPAYVAVVAFDKGETP